MAEKERDETEEDSDPTHYLVGVVSFGPKQWFV